MRNLTDGQKLVLYIVCVVGSLMLACKFCTTSLSTPVKPETVTVVATATPVPTEVAEAVEVMHTVPPQPVATLTWVEVVAANDWHIMEVIHVQSHSQFQTEFPVNDGVFGDGVDHTTFDPSWSEDCTYGVSLVSLLPIERIISQWHRRVRITFQEAGTMQFNFTYSGDSYGAESCNLFSIGSQWVVEITNARQGKGEILYQWNQAISEPGGVVDIKTWP